ncbi:MAG: GNAT family N-acetyltransferase [Bacillota bacterium]|nr:GNAT family N-acetyltransferase [Bacillota bacterium]
MSKTNVWLIPLTEDDREQFIKDNQWAFKYGSMEEFGLRNAQFEEDGEIISRKTIEDSIDQGETYRIMCDGEKAGGVVIHTDGDKGELDLLFTLPDVHSKGIGYAAWCAIEKMHPEVRVWETFTPYFETRNIHFYVNKCGFHIVEFFNPFHTEPMCPEDETFKDEDGSKENGFDFLFQKVIER